MRDLQRHLRAGTSWQNATGADPRRKIVCNADRILGFHAAGATSLAVPHLGGAMARSCAHERRARPGRVRRWRARSGSRSVPSSANAHARGDAVTGSRGRENGLRGSLPVLPRSPPVRSLARDTQRNPFSPLRRQECDAQYASAGRIKQIDLAGVDDRQMTAFVAAAASIGGTCCDAALLDSRIPRGGSG